MAYDNVLESWRLQNRELLEDMEHQNRTLRSKLQAMKETNIFSRNTPRRTVRSKIRGHSAHEIKQTSMHGRFNTVHPIKSILKRRISRSPRKIGHLERSSGSREQCNSKRVKQVVFEKGEDEDSAVASEEMGNTTGVFTSYRTTHGAILPMSKVSIKSLEKKKTIAEVLEKTVSLNVLEQAENLLTYTPKSRFLRNFKERIESKKLIQDPGNQRYPKNSPLRTVVFAREDKPDQRKRRSEDRRSSNRQDVLKSSEVRNKTPKRMIADDYIAERFPVPLAHNRKKTTDNYVTGLDVVAGLVENEDRCSKMDCEQWFSELARYRQENWKECHAVPARLSKETGGKHECKHYFRANERLFLEPVMSDEAGRSRCLECHSATDSSPPKAVVSLPTTVLMGEHHDEILKYLKNKIEANRGERLDKTKEGKRKENKKPLPPSRLSYIKTSYFQPVYDRPVLRCSPRKSRRNYSIVPPQNSMALRYNRRP